MNQEQPNLFDVCKQYGIDTYVYNVKEANQLLFNSVTNKKLIPQLLHYLYKDIIVYTSMKIWFYYDKLWIPQGKAKTRYFDNYVDDLINKYDSLIEKLEQCELKIYIKKIKNIENWLSLNITKIQNECKKLFFKSDEEFLYKLDRNIYSIAFDNGVYDLITKEFRQIEKEDFITLTTEYDYDPNPIYVEEVMNTIKQILPNEQERNKLLKICACGLAGISLKKMICLVSDDRRLIRDGGNGKSTFICLLFKTLGEYCNNLDCLFEGIGSYIIQEGKNKKIHKRYGKLVCGRRVVRYGEIFSEFCKEKRILELTDEKNLIDDCKFNMFVESNGTIKNNECIIIKFNVEFVDRIKYPEFQVLCNRDVTDNFDKWKSSFMKILLDYWDLYKIEGL